MSEMYSKQHPILGSVGEYYILLPSMSILVVREMCLVILF